MALDPRSSLGNLQRGTLTSREELGGVDRFRIQRAEQQRSQLGNAGFANFDAILGLQRQLSGNQSLRGPGGELLSLADVAGQQDIQLGEGEQATLRQFFSPSVTGDQQKTLEALAKRASAQGLRGGAVRGQLGDLATRFIAGNRAQSFSGVQEIIGSRLNQIEQETNPFLQQVGGLRQLLAQGQSPGVLRSSGGTTGEFQQFAQLGIRALSSVGLGADALAGIAERQGAQFDRAGLTGAGDVSQAFQQFLAPDTQGFGQFLSNQGFQVGRTSQGFFGQGGAAGGRNLSRAINRVGAGEQLAGRIGQQVLGLGQEAAEFSALGTVSINPFTSTGDFGAAKRLANLDFSRFEGLTSALGFGQGGRTSQGTAGATSGSTFLSNNPLFNTVFGRS